MLDTLKNKENIFHFILFFSRKPFTCGNNAVTPNQEFSLPLLHHLLLQTNLDRTHSCQHEAKASAHLLLTPYTMNRVCSRKFNLLPNQLHSGNILIYA